MLHINGNYDIKYVIEDVELFLPLLNPNGIVVMDDIGILLNQYMKIKRKYCSNF